MNYYPYKSLSFIIVLINILNGSKATAYFIERKTDCGQYGFVCESNKKLRLCDGSKLYGPIFVCPPSTICNEESNSVCESIVNYIDPAFNVNSRCRRNERIPDPSVPGCKGYILCVPKNKGYQAIRFKCSGNTLFNGYSRTCSSTTRYKCPISNTTKFKQDIFATELEGGVRPDVWKDNEADEALAPTSPLNCKHYKFRVSEEGSPMRAEFFCPSKLGNGETVTRCTVFSNDFCVTLEREDHDLFVESYGAARRKPRVYEFRR